MKKEYLRCSECGKFMSLYDKDAVIYTPYGQPTDIDPPESEYICGRCWVRATEDKRSLIESISWIPPHHIIT